MVEIPKTKLNFTKPISYNAQVAKAKNTNSSNSRTIPGVAIGDEPERLGSFGTAKVPQIAARIIGMPMAKTILSHPSLCLHPQIPVDASADSSSINRIARLIGCDPI